MTKPQALSVLLVLGLHFHKHWLERKAESESIDIIVTDIDIDIDIISMTLILRYNINKYLSCIPHPSIPAKLCFSCQLIEDGERARQISAPRMPPVGSVSVEGGHKEIPPLTP